MSEMFIDLLNFASDHLSYGGRLVFWIPVIREEYSEEKLPQHPNLKLQANCEQVLSSHTSRRLIVMERTTNDNESGSTSGASAEVGLVPQSSATFREQFYLGATEIPRKERKERIKKYGHLNLKGEEGEESEPEEEEELAAASQSVSPEKEKE